MKKLHGIMATGRTQQQAINTYRLLSMGKGAVVFTNDRDAFIGQASADLFNPMTGDMDMEQDTAATAKVQFASTSSVDGLEVEYKVCTNGCGTHIIAESSSILSYCPICTSALSESEDGDDLPENDEEDDDVDLSLPSDDDEDVSESEDDEYSEDDSEDDEDVSESEDDEYSEDDSEDDEDVSESEDDEYSEDDSESEDDEDDEDVSESEDDEYSEDDSEEEEIIAEESEFGDEEGVCVVSNTFALAAKTFAEAAVQEGVSVSNGMVESHYAVCSSEDCGKHIISTSEVYECPICYSATEEPETDETDTETETDYEDEDVSESEDDFDDDSDGDSDEDDGFVETSEDETETDLGMTDEDGNILTGETEEIVPLNDVPDDVSASALDVSYGMLSNNPAWFAYVNGAPVAVAVAADAGSNADVFDSAKFGHITIASAKVNGVKDALKDLGFKPFTHKVVVSSVIDNIVARKVEEERAALAADKEEFEQRWVAAMATAAVGLTRGFWKDTDHPLKDALWKTMSAVGIAQPEVLIDNAFAGCADMYHKQLLAKTQEILAKPLEVQASLAESIMDSNYMRVATASVSSTIETRLGSVGEQVSTSSVTEKPEPKQYKSALSGLGRRY